MSSAGVKALATPACGVPFPLSVIKLVGWLKHCNLSLSVSWIVTSNGT